MAFKINIGELRNRVYIEQLVPTFNSCNEQLPDEWKKVSGCVPCRITAKGGGEQTISDKQVSIVTYEVVMRYRPSVVPMMRLDWDGKILNIDAVFDPEGRRRWTVCLCKEAT